MTLAKLFNLSESLDPHLENRDNHSKHLFDGVTVRIAGDYVGRKCRNVERIQ